MMTVICKTKNEALSSSTDKTNYDTTIEDVNKESLKMLSLKALFFIKVPCTGLCRIDNAESKTGTVRQKDERVKRHADTLDFLIIFDS